MMYSKVCVLILVGIWSCLLSSNVIFICANEDSDSVESSEVRQGSGNMFDGIADSYDLLNKIISIGLDDLWRSEMVRALNLSGKSSIASSPLKVLDVSTGTGDVAITVAKSIDSVQIYGIDPSEKMLLIGTDKVKSWNFTNRVTLTQGVAEKLDFESDSFDVIFVAFGVRNFEDRKKGLSEMSRVVKPSESASIAILELSEPQDEGIFSRLAQFFVHQLVPFVGGIISGKPDDYKYLASSMGAFPQPEEFESLLNSANLQLVSHQRLAPFECGPNLYLVRKAGSSSSAETIEAEVELEQGSDEL